MMLVSLLFAAVLSFTDLTKGDWSQQFGDPSSNNFVDLDSDEGNIPSGWNYTGDPDYSMFYGSPAVSEKGVIYIPYLEYPQYWLQLRAILPNGTLFWLANYVGGDESCSVVFMTNAVYSSEHGLVLVGWTCLDAGAYYAKQGQVVAYDAATGKGKWRSSILYDASDMSTLSICDGLVFITGGYSCGRDGGAVQHPHKNISQVVVLDLVSGKIIENIDYIHTGCESQTKCFTDKKGVTRVLLPVNLPQLFKKPNGSVLCLECQRNASTCKQIWLQDIMITWDAKFGISSSGFVFGSHGLMGSRSHNIFGMDITTGSMAFSDKGYCNSGSYPSGPAVDNTNGYAYYSCGNLVFAIDTSGSLIWKSKPFNSTLPGYEAEYLLKLSPALYSNRKILLAVSTDSSYLVTLSTSDGSIIKLYDIPRLPPRDNGVWEPPIIVGSSVYLIKSENLKNYYLFSLSLHDVTGLDINN